MRRALGLLALLTLNAALAQSSLRLTVGGEAVPEKAIVVNGQTYVPLSVLKRLGVQVSARGGTLALGAQNTPATAPGGSNQRASLEGCIGETLFNGVWRLTVRKVEQIAPDVGLGPGWGVTVELRNGTRTKTQLHDTGLDTIDLVLPDGNTLAFDERGAEEPFIYQELAQAGGVTYQLKFHAQDYKIAASSVPRPAKLIVQLDPKRLTAGYLLSAKVAYSTPTPSFRVNLTCQK